MTLYQAVLKYLGWDAETKRMRRELGENLDLAGKKLGQIQRRLEETSKISVTSRTALHKTLSESDFGQRRAAGGG